MSAVQTAMTVLKAIEEHAANYPDLRNEISQIESLLARQSSMAGESTGACGQFLITAVTLRSPAVRGVLSSMAMLRHELSVV